MGSGKKYTEASDKAIAAKVTEEMAHPRMTLSAKEAADRQRKVSHRKPTRQNAPGAVKGHLEQYGTGTPTVKRKS